MDMDEAIKEVSKEVGIVLKEKKCNAITSFCQGNDSFICLPAPLYLRSDDAQMTRPDLHNGRTASLAPATN